MNKPGAIVLLGSGEEGPVGREALRWLRASGREPRSAVVLETPAGFELNAEAVAGRWARAIRRQPEMRRAEVEQVPARRRGTPFTPDDPIIARPILGADLIALGAGSPTYVVRQLRASVAWQNAQAAHLCGASLLLASAAAIAVGTYALPVYEIYKVGDDPHWKDGLGLFELYGLRLAVVTHWNNGHGREVDTSRCFVGKARFDALAAELPADVTIVGVDEHTALAIDPATADAQVLGQGSVTVIREGDETSFASGELVPLDRLGAFALPDPERVLTPSARAAVAEARDARKGAQAPAEVDALVVSRQDARAKRDFDKADGIRREIEDRGWHVEDTPSGPRVLPRR